MKNEEIELNRKEIKKWIPDVLDFYWEICDKHLCFDLNLNETSIQGSNYTDLIIETGTRSIIENYQSLINTIVYSEAYDKLSTKLELIDKRMSMKFKYHFRNYYARRIIPAYLEFADHISYHLNEISEKTIFEYDKEHLIDYRKIRNTLDKNANVKHIKKENVNRTFEILFNNLTSRLLDFFQVYRNTVYHRYELGIDRMLKSFRSRIRSKTLGLVTISTPDVSIGDLESIHYDQYGNPDVKYIQFRELAPTLLQNSKETLIFLNCIGYIAEK